MARLICRWEFPEAVGFLVRRSICRVIAHPDSYDVASCNEHTGFPEFCQGEAQVAASLGVRPFDGSQVLAIRQ